MSDQPAHGQMDGKNSTLHRWVQWCERKQNDFDQLCYITGSWNLQETILRSWQLAGELGWQLRKRFLWNRGWNLWKSPNHQHQVSFYSLRKTVQYIQISIYLLILFIDYLTNQFRKKFCALESRMTRRSFQATCSQISLIWSTRLILIHLSRSDHENYD